MKQMRHGATALLSALGMAAVGAIVGCARSAPADSATQEPTGGGAVQAAEWTARAPLPERRTEVSATTDGRYVYVAGGFAPADDGSGAATPRTLWRYDPEADSWTDLTEIPEGIHHAPFQHHQGRLYILGGFRGTSFTPVANVRIYDLATGEWSEGAPMPTPRGATGWAVLNGKIHVLGGNVAGGGAVAGQPGVQVTGDNSVNVHEAYDPAANEWVRLAPMPTPRNHLGAAEVGGRIHAVLGRADGDFTLTAHEIYDPAADTWTAGPDVPTGRSGVAVLGHGGAVYAFGGEAVQGGRTRTFADAERYVPGAGEWERLEPMPTSRHGLGAAVVDGAIYVIGGGPEAGFAFSDANERLVPEE